MSKHMIVMIANMKYAHSDNFYLTANSYMVEDGSAEDTDKAIQDFLKNIDMPEVATVQNVMCYIPPKQDEPA